MHKVSMRTLKKYDPYTYYLKKWYFVFIYNVPRPDYKNIYNERLLKIKYSNTPKSLTLKDYDFHRIDEFINKIYYPRIYFDIKFDIKKDSLAWKEAQKTVQEEPRKYDQFYFDKDKVVHKSLYGGIDGISNTDLAKYIFDVPYQKYPIPMGLLIGIYIEDANNACSYLYEDRKELKNIKKYIDNLKKIIKRLKIFKEIYDKYDDEDRGYITIDGIATPKSNITLSEIRENSISAFEMMLERAEKSKESIYKRYNKQKNDIKIECLKKISALLKQEGYKKYKFIAEKIYDAYFY